MKNYSEVLSFEGYTPQQFIQLISLAMKSLQWTSQVLNDSEIEGEVKASPWANAYKVSVQVYENEAWITGKSSQLGFKRNKNKKNVEVLRDAIVQLQLHYSPEQLEEPGSKLLIDKEEFLFDFEKNPVITQAQTNKQTKNGLWGYLASCSLIAIMLIVFVLMVLSGVSIFDPSAAEIFVWGGNFQPYTVVDDYWRLITHLFVHVGIIHLVLNLYALFIIGQYLEPIIGRGRLLLYFLITGIMGGIVSIWWDAGRISAGASGAIFGLYGVFMILLLSGLLGKEMKKNLLTSIGVFIAANLIYGIKDNIDNAAHLGGLVCGTFIGLLMTMEIKWPKQRLILKTATIVLPLVIAYSYLDSADNSDLDFTFRLQQIAMLDSDADWPITSGSGKSDQQMAGDMERTSIPKWTEIASILKRYQPKELNPLNEKLHIALTDYTTLRLKEANMYIQKADDSLHFSPKALEMLQLQIKQKKTSLQELSK